MVSIATVRANNAEIKKLGPGLVGVFVGATSGIGETTAREFVRHALKPRVYIVGRNETQATSIIKELQGLNPEGDLRFIKSDVSLLRNVDKVCDEIKEKEGPEGRINLLVLTQGMLTMAGRNETEEGLDKKFSLHYYSRLRFVHNLQPLLSKAAQSPLPGVSPLSRVISVLAPSTEGTLNLADLSLRNPGSFTLSSCAGHTVTMNSLAVTYLANQHPETSFIHANPGAVKTNIVRDMGFLTQKAFSLLATLLGPFMGVGLKESGERHTHLATSNLFPSKSEGKSGEDVAIGSDKSRGSGAYLVSPWGDVTGRESILKPYREDGTVGKVWEHTLDVFNKICGVGGTGRYDG